MMSEDAYVRLSSDEKAAITMAALRQADDRVAECANCGEPTRVGLLDLERRCEECSNLPVRLDRLGVARAVAALAAHVQVLALQLCDAETVFDAKLTDDELRDIMHSLDRISREMEA